MWSERQSPIETLCVRFWSSAAETRTTIFKVAAESVFECLCSPRCRLSDSERLSIELSCGVLVSVLSRHCVFVGFWSAAETCATLVKMTAESVFTRLWSKRGCQSDPGGCLSRSLVERTSESHRGTVRSFLVGSRNMRDSHQDDCRVGLYATLIEARLSTSV